MCLEILYEDADIIVCYKPSGVATQTKRLGQQDMESLLKNYRVSKGEPPYIGVVHRLDQPVEGVMVYAKNEKAAAQLSRQVRERQIGKHYYAVGINQNSQQRKSETGRRLQRDTLTDYMSWNGRTNQAYMDEKGKKAVLEYEVLASKDNQVLFDITLHTGRHHQIRLQLAHHGYPIAGDKKYGSLVQQERGTYLALCSYRLQFTHPVTKKEMDFSIQPRNPSILDLYHYVTAN